MDQVAAGVMIVMGALIAGVWTRDIISGEKIDLTRGLLAARDPDAGTLLWPHWLAEYVTAAALITAALALVWDASWATALASLATGALLYTSTNSLAWALSEPERRTYAIPMLAGIAAGLSLAAYLLTR